MTSFLEQPSRFLFFTGKGGVGKTALACATAIRLADAGKRVLLVSTDPASNLDEMLGVRHSTIDPHRFPDVDGLSALNIDPEKAADDYRERVIAPYRGIWTESQIAELREQLAGACTVEIAAFDEFAELLAGDERQRAVRSRPVRHGADGPHPAAAQLAARVDRLPAVDARGRLVPRPALGAEDAGGAVRRGARGAGATASARPSCS